MKLGQTLWCKEDLKGDLLEFANLYKSRPIKDNKGGMKFPQMFAAWFALKFLKPKYVIESGVWWEQGTWFFEKAVPQAQIYSIDPGLGKRKFISKKVQYYDVDFKNIDWGMLGVDFRDCVCFFDDHQNALERLVQVKNFGFKKMLFEDNYPVGCGDCYSLKKAIASVEDSYFLKNEVKIYYEFPPVFKLKKNRWGEDWDKYEISEPLCVEENDEVLKPAIKEAANYTWICYAELY